MAALADSQSVPPAANKNSRWLSSGVLGIGLASLFSDWGHEAGTAILPAFLAGLGAPAYALGVIEGVSDGLSTLGKLAGGWIADRPAWRKPIAILGSLATGFSTFGYAFASTWPFLLVMRAFGWTGRGVRSPAKDALLADGVTAGQVGRAFGFERSMDTLGAVLGPLAAAALLGVLGPRGLLKWTLVPGLLSALAFLFLVPAAKLRQGYRAPRIAEAFSRMPARFWHGLAGIFAHGIGDFAPTLLILRATQLLTSRYGGRAATLAVALYTLYNIVNAAATYPAGALGDRISKRGLLALGYLVGAATFAAFIFAPPSIPALAVLFGLAGLHHGFQQSLEKSLVAEILPGEVRGSGFGVLAAANGIGDLISSIVVGALWSAVSPAAGFIDAAAFALLGALVIYGWR
jgi:MFS family permease